MPALWRSALHLLALHQRSVDRSWEVLSMEKVQFKLSMVIYFDFLANLKTQAGVYYQNL